jgi:hypothetical protein
MSILQSESMVSEDLGAYKGQWVSIAGGHVVGHALAAEDLAGDGARVFFVPHGGFALAAERDLRGDYDYIDEDDLSTLAINSVAGRVDSAAIPWKGAWGGLSAFGDWYMPAPSARLHSRWSTLAVVTVIVGFLIIDAFGLCITSGVLSIA